MNRETTKLLAYQSLSEMKRKIDEYEKRPDASQAYVMRNREHLNNIESYILLTESEEQNSKFNKEFLIVTEQNNDTTRIKQLERRVYEMTQLLQQRGITIQDQAFMIKDLKEIERSNSLAKFRQIWPELC